MSYIKDYKFGQLKFQEVIFRNQVFLRNEIENEVRKLRDYLKSRIFSPSPFIYLEAVNHVKTLISFWAVHGLGKICVIIDPGIKPLELEIYKNEVNPGAIISPGQELNFSYRDEIEFCHTKNQVHQESELEDVVLMGFTNAADGIPKAVMLTRNNLLHGIVATFITEKLKNVTAILPYSHLFGFIQGLLAPAHGECKILIPEFKNFYNLKPIVEDINQYKITNLFATPLVYNFMIRIPGIKDYLADVRRIITGGVKLPKSIFEKFHEVTGKYLYEGYGLTEASPVCTSNREGEKIKIESVGEPFPFTNLRVVDDEGIELKPGQVGEIQVKGENVMKGYYNHPNLNKQVLNDGWLSTGDLGYLDEDGYLYFMGLKKRMINCAGLNIYPAEVEKLIRLNKNVQNITVLGQKDEIFGEIPRAIIQLKDNSEKLQQDLKQWCKMIISNFKIPKKWDFIDKC